MVLISEVGDLKYITKVRWFFGNPSNYLPFILHLGPDFEFFLFLFLLSSAVISLIVPLSFQLWYI